MNSDRFEAGFSDFLDGADYDAGQDALYSLVREAYAAGWRAAGGDPGALPQRSGEKIRRLDMPPGGSGPK